MLSVCSPSQLDPTPSFPFDFEMRANVGQNFNLPAQPPQPSSLTLSHKPMHIQQPPHRSRPQPAPSPLSGSITSEGLGISIRSPVIKHEDDLPSTTTASSATTAGPSSSSSSSSSSTSSSSTTTSSSVPSSMPANMVPSQPQLAQPQYAYPPVEYSTTLPPLPMPSSAEYPASTFATMATPTNAALAYAQSPATNSHDRRLSTLVEQSHEMNGGQLLPPLSETLHRMMPEQGSSAQPPMATSSMHSITHAPPPPAGNYYPPAPYMDVPITSTMYPSSQEVMMMDSQKSHAMAELSQMRHDGPPPSHMLSTSSQSYNRRVTYPFVPSIDTSSGLMMSNMTSSESSGSSPLNGGMVGMHSAPPSQGMMRPTSSAGYVDALALSHQSTWMRDGEMIDSNQTSKVYSFVPLSGVNTKKRPRRRFDEIERLYVCNWSDCEKSYGTLNHLNAHVSMQKHGPKRHPAEFKELRKAWRRQKRQEEEAAKQAAAFHQQQTHAQQLQYMCDPVTMHQQPPVQQMAPMQHPHAQPNLHMQGHGHGNPHIHHVHPLSHQHHPSQAPHMGF